MRIKSVAIRMMSLIMIMFAVGVSPVQADDDVMEKIQMMENRIKDLENRLAVYEVNERGTDRKLSQVEEKVSGFEGELEQAKTQGIGALPEGIEIGAGATFVYQFTDNANGDGLSINGEDVNDATYSVDVELTKEFANGDVAVVIFEAGEGDGVDGDLSTFAAVNADATGSASSLSITEAWYQHGFDPFAVIFGKVAGDAFLDANEYAGDEAAQFLGAAFKNSATVALPDNGAGLIFGWEASEVVTVEALVMDGNADWENIADDVFYGAQVTVAPKLFDRPGNYRFFAWGSEADHTKWSDATATQEDNYGLGVSFDQELTDDLGVFARYAWQNPDVYVSGASETLEHAYTVGMQLGGSSWNREDDVVGLGFAAIVPSDDYKNSNSALKADTEKYLELYYSYKVNDHLTISPDLQIVWDPYGGDAVNGDKTILIGGIRSQIDF